MFILFVPLRQTFFGFGIFLLPEKLEKKVRKQEKCRGDGKIEAKAVADKGRGDKRCQQKSQALPHEGVSLPDNGKEAEKENKNAHKKLKQKLEKGKKHAFIQQKIKRNEQDSFNRNKDERQERQNACGKEAKDE